MFCMECGTKLPEHAKFCFHCGAKVETPDEAPTPEANNVELDLEMIFGKGWKDDAPAERSLAPVFASLDPIACHSEYYFSRTPLLKYYTRWR